MSSLSYTVHILYVQILTKLPELHSVQSRGQIPKKILHLHLWLHCADFVCPENLKLEHDFQNCTVSSLNPKHEVVYKCCLMPRVPRGRYDPILFPSLRVVERPEVLSEFLGTWGE